MHNSRLLIATAVVSLTAAAADAVVIDNDIPLGTLGHFSVDVRRGGETGFDSGRDTQITANGLVSGPLDDTNLVYDYFSYVDVELGGFQLSGGNDAIDATPAGNDTATSSGSFVGSNANTIDWSVSSSIPDGGSIMTSVFTFAARTGTLGDIDFYQYLDEDVDFNPLNDVLLSRGSAAGHDLELFTIDNDEAYGISHGGAYSAAQGLINSTFSGWAADTYDDMKPHLVAGTQTVSLAGVIDQDNDSALPLFNHPQVGAARGPNDIVSVLAWQVDPNAETATIVTTLGGVPDVQRIPPPPPSDTTIPEPTTAALFLVAMGMITTATRRR